ncbi:MAG TPA: serine/threonine-protein kinase [Candidatus Binatia bacterium]|nr:serine/threonine-protein kinase [Candidatus Binatia bacterium]
MNEPIVLDRYRLIERLASGGSAEVWRAHDEQLDREVAVKRLHPHLLPDEPSRKRLAAEARAAAGLSHPVIVGVYDVDATGDAPAIVMELVEGESLAARIARDGPLEPHRAAAVAADVAEALFHAHQRGVVHRDVKPGNVLLATDGRTRLVDFGIAHSLAESAERLTMAGTVIGTMSAMAPEQLAGGPITPRTDLYGIGVVLHEALTGRPPYPASSPVGLAEAQRAGPPVIDGVDPVLAGLVAACLAVDVEDRPLHAGALAVALRGWIAGDPTAALAMTPTGLHRRPAGDTDTAEITQPIAVAPAPAAASAAARRPTASSGGGRRRGLLLGLAALALGALAVLAVGGALQDGLVAEATPSPSAGPLATPVATPVPTTVVLRGWAAKLAEDYEEECGAAFDPAWIAGMDKEQAEDAIEPQIDACEDDD